MSDWEDDLDRVAERYERFHRALVEALGEPTLVTDPADNITRPTWQLKGMSDDDLAEMCRAHNARLGWELTD